MANVAVLTLQIVSNQAEQKAKRMTRTLKQMNLSALTVARSVRNLGLALTAALTVPLVLAGKAAVQAAAQFEQARIAFGVFVGDMEKGARIFERLFEFSARTPLRLDALQEAAQILIATGATGESLIDTLKRLGDVSRGNNATLTRAALILGQVATAGKLTGRTLLRLDRAIIPVRQELIKMFDTTSVGLRKMVSAGQVGFKDVLAALRSMTSEGGRFNNLLDKMSQTLTGKFTTAVDNVRLALAAFIEPIQVEIKQFLDIIINISKTLRMLTPEFKRMVGIVLAVVAAIGPIVTILGSLFLAFVTIKALLVFIGTSVGAILLIFGKILIAIGLVIAVVEGLRRAWGVTWEDIGKMTLDFASKFIGFFVNIRANWTTLLNWLGRNWANLLTDMLTAGAVFGVNFVKNLIHAMGIAGSLFQITVSHIIENWETIGPAIKEELTQLVATVATLAFDIGQAIIDSMGRALAGGQVIGTGRFAGGDGAPEPPPPPVTLADKLAKALKKGQKGFTPFLQGFERTTEKFPEFLTGFDFLIKNLKQASEDFGVQPDGEGAATDSLKLSEALRAGSKEAFALMTGRSTREDRAAVNQKKIVKNTDRTAKGVGRMLREGVRIVGVQRVDRLR